MKLTGAIRYRRGWRGRLILQVEEAYKHVTMMGPTVDVENATRWRDARIEDLKLSVRAP